MKPIILAAGALALALMAAITNSPMHSACACCAGIVLGVMSLAEAQD
jgi:hypothetical protein